MNTAAERALHILSENFTVPRTRFVENADMRPAKLGKKPHIAPVFPLLLFPRTGFLKQDITFRRVSSGLALVMQFSTDYCYCYWFSIFFELLYDSSP